MSNPPKADKPTKPRNPNGAGSLYWTKNHNGKEGWIFQTSVWDPVKKKSRYTRGFGGKSVQLAYQRHRDLVQKQVLTGGEKQLKTVTLVKYLETWLSDLEPAIGAQTYRKYRKDIENHVIPTLGAKQLGKITKDDYRDLFYKTLKDSGTSARNHAYSTLTGMLNHAVREGVIENNELQKVAKPKHRSVVKKYDDKYSRKRAEMSVRLLEWLSEPDNKYKDHRNRILFMFLGLRRSEILGLEWDSVTSLDKKNNGKIVINRSLNRHEPHTGKKGYYIQPYTKTENERKIVLPEAFRKALIDEKKKNRTATDKQFSDLVFLSKSGTPISWGRHDTIWREVLLAYYNKNEHKYDKLPAEDYFRPHAVRHLTATFLYMSGTPAREAAEFLGHTTEKMTEHYTHLQDEGKIAASAGLAKQLRL